MLPPGVGVGGWAVGKTHRINHVVHQLVDFGPFESRFAAVPHDFSVGS